jgi:hypothetical protein
VIKNATLQRVDAPGAPTTGGDPTWTAGSVIHYRCCIQGITMAVKRVVDAEKITGDTELYVALADWPTASQSLVNDAVVLVLPDPVGGNALPAETYRIARTDLVRGGLTAIRCVLLSQ